MRDILRTIAGHAAGLKAYLIIAAVALAAGLTAGAAGSWKVRDWMAAEAALKVAKADANAVRRAMAKTIQANSVSNDVGAAATAERIRIEYRTRTLIKEVPIYVTAETDARYPLPVGLVRMHDAAALGRDVSDVPDAAGRADGDASDVEASDLAVAVSENYGACLAWRDSVTRWQDWWRRQAAVAAQP